MRTEIEVVPDGKGTFSVTLTHEDNGSRGRMTLRCGLSFREATVFADGVSRGFVESRNALARMANLVREPVVLLPERRTNDG